MQPGRYDFKIRKGDTERLSVILRARDVFSQEIAPALKDGDVVHWRVTHDGAATEKTTASGGGLVFDADDASISYPLSAEETQALPTAQPVTYAVRVVSQGGSVDTYLVGSIIVTSEA